MKVTTEKIISILPFDEKFKEQMLTSYSTLDVDTKFQVEQLLWLTYDAYFEARLQERLAEAMIDFESGVGTPSVSFYADLRTKIEKEFMEGAVKVSEKVDLVEAREKIEELVNGVPQSVS